MQTNDLESEPEDIDRIAVRALAPEDLDWIVRIDAQGSRQPRHEYYRLKLDEAARDTGIRISLAAIVDDMPAGFCMGRLYYGEFGQPEPVAILDSIGVAKAYRGQQVARALMRQLETNLRGLGIERLETQIDWDRFDLLRFFQRSGFLPAARLCLEKRLG